MMDIKGLLYLRNIKQGKQYHITKKYICICMCDQTEYVFAWDSSLYCVFCPVFLDPLVTDLRSKVPELHVQNRIEKIQVSKFHGPHQLGQKVFIPILTEKEQPHEIPNLLSFSSNISPWAPVSHPKAF